MSTCGRLALSNPTVLHFRRRTRAGFGASFARKSGGQMPPFRPSSWPGRAETRLAAVAVQPALAVSRRRRHGSTTTSSSAPGNYRAGQPGPGGFFPAELDKFLCAAKKLSYDIDLLGAYSKEQCYAVHNIAECEPRYAQHLTAFRRPGHSRRELGQQFALFVHWPTGLNRTRNPLEPDSRVFRPV